MIDLLRLISSCGTIAFSSRSHLVKSNWIFSHHKKYEELRKGSSPSCSGYNGGRDPHCTQREWLYQAHKKHFDSGPGAGCCNVNAVCPLVKYVKANGQALRETQQSIPPTIYCDSARHSRPSLAAGFTLQALKICAHYNS